MDMLKEKVPPFICSSSGQKLPRKSESFAQDKVTHADLQWSQHNTTGCRFIPFLLGGLSCLLKKYEKFVHAIFCTFRWVCPSFFQKEIEHWDFFGEIFWETACKTQNLHVKRRNLFPVHLPYPPFFKWVHPSWNISKQRLWKLKFTVWV